MGRGTIIQVVLATFISFFFFAMSVKEQPFNARHLNMIKIFSEVQLFGNIASVFLTCMQSSAKITLSNTSEEVFSCAGILLILVVLQTDKKTLATQSVTADVYGVCQLILALAVIPVALYMMFKGLSLYPLCTCRRTRWLHIYRRHLRQQATGQVSETPERHGHK